MHPTINMKRESTIFYALGISKNYLFVLMIEELRNLVSFHTNANTSSSNQVSNYLYLCICKLTPKCPITTSFFFFFYIFFMEPYYHFVHIVLCELSNRGFMFSDFAEFF